MALLVKNVERSTPEGLNNLFLFLLCLLNYKGAYTCLNNQKHWLLNALVVALIYPYLFYQKFEKAELSGMMV